MDKKSKETIKEVISDILQIREGVFEKFEPTRHFMLDESFDEFKKKLIKKQNEIIIEKFDIPLIKLNNLLEKQEQFQEVIEIEKQMAKIQAKKYITVKEFSEIYNVSKTSQQNYRGRLYDPLPYHQKVEAGKIVYVVEEVEKWFENQHK